MAAIINYAISHARLTIATLIFLLMPRDMQAVLKLVWDRLLPELKPASLPADDAARQKLEARLKGLVLRLPESKGTPLDVAGKTFVFPTNDRKLESITIKQGKDGCVTLVAQAAVPCGEAPVIGQ